jgi:hypothetical protein
VKRLGILATAWLALIVWLTSAADAANFARQVGGSVITAGGVIIGLAPEMGGFLKAGKDAAGSGKAPAPPPPLATTPTPSPAPAQG